MKKKYTKAKSLGKVMRFSPFDPFGSYTGKAKDNEKPVQDADDL